jgi:hypothetical protein
VHLLGIEGSRTLKQPVSKCGLAMIDMSDNAEIPYFFRF